MFLKSSRCRQFPGTKFTGNQRPFFCVIPLICRSNVSLYLKPLGVVHKSHLKFLCVVSQSICLTCLSSKNLALKFLLHLGHLCSLPAQQNAHLLNVHYMLPCHQLHTYNPLHHMHTRTLENGCFYMFL